MESVWASAQHFGRIVTSSTEIKYSPWIRPLRGLMSLERIEFLVLAIRAKYLKSVLGGRCTLG